VHDSNSSRQASPLDRDELLDQIFSYVGGGDHLFVAGVSRRWRGRYLQYCADKSTLEHDLKFATTCTSAIISEGRLQHAKQHGFRITDVDITQSKYARLICKYSLEPERVVTLLRLHGVPWDTVICRTAAFYGKLSLLQWLHSNDCPWTLSLVLSNACRSARIATLQWLAAVTEPWSESIMSKMLDSAASCNHLALTKWLRARGAPWPSSFASKFTDQFAATVRQCWPVSAVQWAVAAGSGWLHWKCEDYAAEKYSKESMKHRAADVLTWAHANGCPCTCGHQQQQQQQQQ
jgi:hypothetical protein